jgi:signal transduction histidine kinase
MERELKKLNTVVHEFPAHEPRKKGRAGSGSPQRSQHADSAHEIKERTAKLEKYLAVAKGEISRLDYIITQFLQAIRPRPPEFIAGALNDVVQETIELLRPEVENRGINIELRLARRLPAVPLDPAQIKQVLVNLIKNAIQAMTKGGILKLQTGIGAEGVWVSISDTGCGIPPEKLNHIFEPFYTTKKKGTGLGLMIVQRIVREHGGRIELDSRLNHGTTFRVWLPLEGKVRLLEAGTREESGKDNLETPSGVAGL